MLPRLFGLLHAGPDDHFVDIGCGKGRALLLAMQRGVGKITGIDISPALISTATANVDVFQKKLQYDGKTSVECADAATFSVPDDATLIHMYCPFIGDDFRRFITCLHKNCNRTAG